ncbi:(p)ppGpp synthetase, RelA/SpoT family [Beggiatoa alba B18LD]|uniref:GTP pyrophosphokinase n=1 Tax=Beggiatoa alba B18LD TaxID=395493 RepID=I3CII3_9GAMM|nr:GTP diphosphokinase [Beggiatoa alba]EIJ43426.1 (p)ppGpp synthetase, RelA/SpoT family [Beggiatoa alba B18LD]
MVSVKDPLLLPVMGNTLNVNNWLTLIMKGRSASEQQAIQQAYQFACEIYQEQTRPSGEPYLIHVLTVADILADLGMDTDVLVAAILHEALDQHFSLETIQNRFGKVVTNLLDGVNKMRFIDNLIEYQKFSEESQEAEGLRKMLLAMVEDVRVVLIKLADRLHNMRTLKHLPIDVQKRFAQDTLDIFVPLANRLGIWQIKWELEDLALRYLHADEYQEIARKLDEKRVDRERYIAQVIQILQEELRQAGIKGDVMGRPKHIYSIWRKMQKKNLDFDRIYDIRAVRVLVHNVHDCYLALGLIHSKWKHLPSEFDDYISNPKPNNYQSLHTAVYGPEDKVFEVQIRTEAMHHHAELGVASHWRYKENSLGYDKNFEQKIGWLRKVLKMKEENTEGDVDFIDQFKSEILDDRVYVMSPQGKVLDLPTGSTPLDFAYHIHTSLGHRCRGAKINNRIVSLNYILKSGDQVEILAAKDERPSRDWLVPHFNYLKTSRARSKVKQWLKKQDEKQHLRDGRTLLERELRRLNLHEVNYDKLATRFKLENAEQLMLALGRGDLTLQQIAHALNEQVFPEKTPIYPVTTQPYKTDGIIIKGVGGLLSYTARCCNPIPYEPIIGYITKGRGVAIHRRDCPHAVHWQDEENERLIEVTWSRQDAQTKPVFPVDIQIHAYDRTGLLRDITVIAANENINIIAVNTISNKAEHMARMQFTLEVSNLEELSNILARIDNLPNVIEAYRKI